MPKQIGSEAIAVIGLGCVLPDAFDVASFWRNVQAGRSAIRPLQGEPWRWQAHYDADPAAPDRMASLLGARVEGWSFDWRRFRMPPAEAQLVNPMQLMVLEAGAQALGQVREIPRATTGLVLGATGLGWQRDSGLRIRLREIEAAVRASDRFSSLPRELAEGALKAARATLEGRLRPVSEDNVVNASASVAAGRIAMHFDLRGLHYAIDAGFASSLAAVDAGARLLRDGSLDLVIVGGASELLSPLELIAFSKLGGLARSKVAPFDAAAEGTLLGEGVALFALKRLDDALRDGETIHAVIRGVGGATDGPGRALCAPHPEGQALAMRRAYEDGDVDPATVGYVECHATGTPVGDASEVRALSSVYGRAGGPVLLGSAKPFVGHLRAGAGAVGLLRAVCALREGTVPGQIQFARPNPALELEATRFVVPTASTPLPTVDGVARAAVSAFGFGGNNFHVVLESAATSARSSRTARSLAAGTSPRDAIAVVGLGGVFPGAADVPAFWRALLAGHDATTEIPARRWDVSRYYDADRTRNDTCYTRLGCFLDELPTAHERFRIPPAALASLDPSQLLSLRAAEEALADAAFAPGRWDADRVATALAFLPYQGKKFLADIRVNSRELLLLLEQSLCAAGLPEAQARAVAAEAEQRFKAGLPPITEDTLTGHLGSINAARIQRLFGFRGPHFVVDSACASTHAALHAAIAMLRDRTCDVALAGGVWCDMMPEFFVAACRFQALSATGSTPFSAAADGFIPGEGAGLFVLRRLEDAERDGQRIHAVIRSVAGSSDGRGRSVLAPSVEGESLAMRRALDDAGLVGRDVGYVECHGTGTALGDVVEAEACARAFGEGRAEPLAIGSVKSNIGHLNAAAGVPALLKSVLAVREGILPASLKAEPANPKIDFVSGAIRVVTKNEPFPVAPGEPRRAGVSGFGVGGTNLHLIVEEHRPAARASWPEPRPGTKPAASPSPGEPRLSIAVASGGTAADCLEALSAIAARGERDFAAALADAQDAAAGSDGRVRVAIVAESHAELVRKHALLAQALGRGLSPAPLHAQGVFVGEPLARARTAVLFPGQGPQYSNMLREAAARFPVVAETLARIDAAYVRLAGRPLTPAFFTDGEGYTQPDEDIHCAVFAVGCALFRLLASYGFRPDAAMGQSAGELAALVAAGVLSLEDGLLAMRERTLAVMNLAVDDPGRMVALACGAEKARALCAGLPGYAAVAADNAPSSSIVSGDRHAVAALLARAAEAGVEASVLPVSHAYHSRMIAPAREAYGRALGTLSFGAPGIDVVSTITGGSIRDLRADAWPAHLASQFVEPVRLRAAVERLHDDGARVFIECGPRWPITTFVGQILGARPHLAQATLHPKVGEVEQIHRALACLFVHGAAGLRPRALDPATSAPAPSERKETPVRTPPSTPVAAPNAQPVVVIEAAPSPVPELLELLGSLHAQLGSFLSRWSSPATPAAPRFDAAALAAALAQVEGANGHSQNGLANGHSQNGLANGHSQNGLANGHSQNGLANGHSQNGLANGHSQNGLAARAVEPAVTPANDTARGDRWSKVAAPLVAKAPPTESTPDADARPVAVAVAARAIPPAVAGDDPAAVVREVLLRKLVEKTGYPEDMLEPDLDLEGDLGIDTVKQVAVIAETRAHFGLTVDPAFKLRDFPTLAKLLEHLTARLAAARAAATPALVSVAPTGPADAAPVAIAAQSASASASAAAAGCEPAREGAEPARAVLLRKLVEKTGYPEDMIEDGLDLEGDLGIDTVKQLAVIAESRAHFGLPVDAAFKLRDHPTLGALARYLDERVRTERPPARAAVEPATVPFPPATVTAPPVAPTLVAVAAPRVAVTPGARTTVGLLAAAATEHLGAVATLADLRLDRAAAPEGTGVEMLRLDATSARFRLLARSGEPLAEATVTSVDRAPAQSDETRPEIRHAFARPAGGDNGDALLRAVRDAGDGESGDGIAWAWAWRFGEVIGALRVPATAGAGAPIAFALERACQIATYGFFSLTGRVHRVAAIRSARFHRPPSSPQTLFAHARLLPPAGAEWGAHVDLYDEKIRLVARLEVVAAEPEATGERADAQFAWRRFCTAFRDAGAAAAPETEVRR